MDAARRMWDARHRANQGCSSDDIPSKLLMSTPAVPSFLLDARVLSTPEQSGAKEVKERPRMGGRRSCSPTHVVRGSSSETLPYTGRGRASGEPPSPRLLPRPFTRHGSSNTAPPTGISPEPAEQPRYPASAARAACAAHVQ